MSDTPPTIHIQDEAATYEIRLKGQLTDRWAGWFGDVTIGLEEDGTTRLTCPVIDQAALYGLLKKVRSLGMPLLSVNRVESDKTDGGEMMSAMKVCIVGASGKLGQYMVQHALDRGYEVVGVCREKSVSKLDASKGASPSCPARRTTAR